MQRNVCLAHGLPELELTLGLENSIAPAAGGGGTDRYAPPYS